VLFDGEPAALVSVLPGQIVAIAPYDLAGRRQTTVQIAASGVLSTPMIADVATDRAYLTADGSGTGRALARNPDGTLNSPDNPAPQGKPALSTRPASAPPTHRAQRAESLRPPPPESTVTLPSPAISAAFFKSVFRHPSRPATSGLAIPG
jgi:uncharacterized protein (TIGR03437 family)